MARAQQDAEPYDLGVVRYADGDEIQLSFELEGDSEKIREWYAPDRTEKAPSILRPTFSNEIWSGVWEIKTDTYVTTLREVFETLDRASSFLETEAAHIHVSFRRPGTADAPRIADFVHRLDTALFAEALELGETPALFASVVQPYTPAERQSLWSKLEGGGDDKYHLLAVRSIYGENRAGFEIRGAGNLKELKVLATHVVRTLERGAWGTPSSQEHPLDLSIERLTQAINAEQGTNPIEPHLIRRLSGSLHYADPTNNPFSIKHRIALPVAGWEHQPYVPDDAKPEIQQATREYVRAIAALAREVQQAGETNLSQDQWFDVTQRMIDHLYAWGDRVRVSRYLFRSVGMNHWAEVGRSVMEAASAGLGDQLLEKTSQPMRAVPSSGVESGSPAAGVDVRGGWRATWLDRLNSHMARRMLKGVTQANPSTDPSLSNMLDFLQLHGEPTAARDVAEGRVRVFWYQSPKPGTPGRSLGRDIYLDPSLRGQPASTGSQVLLHEWVHAKGGTEMSAYRASAALAGRAGVSSVGYPSHSLADLSDRAFRKLLETVPGHRGKRALYTSDLHWAGAKAGAFAAGAGEFGVAWFLKEAMRAAESRDAKTLNHALNRMRERKFWEAYAAFSLGASAGRMAMGPLMTGPGLWTGLARRSLPLMAGITAVDLLSGSPSPKNIAISGASFLAAGAAMEGAARLALGAGRLLGVVAMPGWANLPLRLLSTALVLHGAEELEGFLHRSLGTEWTRREPSLDRRGLQQHLESLPAGGYNSDE